MFRIVAQGFRVSPALRVVSRATPPRSFLLHARQIVIRCASPHVKQPVLPIVCTHRYSTEQRQESVENQSTQSQQERQPAEAEQKSIFQKVKLFVRKYGITGVVVYFSIYFITLGSIYVALRAGLFNAENFIQWVKDWGLGWLLHTEEVTPGQQKGATFAVAWVITKFTEPFRFAVSVAITPTIYKLVRRILMSRK